MTSLVKKLFKSLADFVVLTIGKVHWKGKNFLDEEQLSSVRSILTPDYFIILTRRKNHLSTYFIGLASFVLTGKWGYWSHALMNTEDEVNSDKDFRLIEATGKYGVAYASFDKVFDVNSVCLLKPKNMSIEHWTSIIDKLKDSVGRPYDTLYNIADDSGMSCVELVRWALMAEPNYEKNFAGFEELIKRSRNLAPQMFYDCGDFEPVYEVRR